MTQLAERLSDLATTGTHAITFEGIGLPADTVRDQVPEVAAGPLAPLLAEAIVHAYDAADGAWKQAAAAFPTGFARQSSVLALTSSLETLLGSPVTAKALAKPLNGALLDGLTEQVEHGPLLAAARLEGAVRLAASDAIKPYQVWDILEELPADGPEDFLERLPRVLGVALDCWAQQESSPASQRPCGSCCSTCPSTRPLTSTPCSSSAVTACGPLCPPPTCRREPPHQRSPLPLRCGRGRRRSPR